MRTTIHVAAALGLAAILTGQVNKTAPPGFSTTVSTGITYSITFGAYFDEISQIADGNYKGTAMSITELNLRRDEQNPRSTGTNVIGKTWTQFQLSVGDCDYNNGSNYPVRSVAAVKNTCFLMEQPIFGNSLDHSRIRVWPKKTMIHELIFVPPGKEQDR